MKAKDLRLLSKEELENKLTDCQKRFFTLQTKRKAGTEKPHLFKEAKKDISRILTILREKKEREGKVKNG